MFGGGSRTRTYEAYAADLQSAPFAARDIPPNCGPWAACDALMVRGEAGVNRVQAGSFGRREIADPELGPLRPAPAVAGQRPGQVELAADAVEHRLTEGALRGPERDGADRLPVAAARGSADMAVPDDAGIDDAVARQGEDGLRRALPEGPGPLDQPHRLGGGPAGADGAVEEERLHRAGLVHGGRQGLAQMGLEPGEVGGL